MGKVLISNIIQPAVWLPYVQEQSVKLNRLIQSGIIVVDSVLAKALGNGGAPFYNVPNYAPLTGSSQVLSDSGSLNVGGITTAKQIAYGLARGDARSVNDLAKWMSGDDPARAIGNGWAQWWKEDEQRILISVLTGLFADNAANDSGDLILNLSIEDGVNAAAGNKMSGTAIVNATQKLGDAKRKFAAIIMHSQVEANLAIAGLISTVRDADGTFLYNSFMGLEVHVDDTCPVVAGSTSGYKYTTYICARGAIGRAEYIDPTEGFEADRDILAGDTVMTMRKKMLLHPYGFAAKYAAGDLAGSTASNDELALAGAWDRVWDKKNTGVVSVVTNG